MPNIQPAHSHVCVHTSDTHTHDRKNHCHQTHGMQLTQPPKLDLKKNVPAEYKGDHTVVQCKCNVAFYFDISFSPLPAFLLVIPLLPTYWWSCIILQALRISHVWVYRQNLSCNYKLWNVLTYQDEVKVLKKSPLSNILLTKGSYPSYDKCTCLSHTHTHIVYTKLTHKYLYTPLYLSVQFECLNPRHRNQSSCWAVWALSLAVYTRTSHLLEICRNGKNESGFLCAVNLSCFHSPLILWNTHALPPSHSSLCIFVSLSFLKTGTTINNCLWLVPRGLCDLQHMAFEKCNAVFLKLPTSTNSVTSSFIWDNQLSNKRLWLKEMYW